MHMDNCIYLIMITAALITLFALTTLTTPSIWASNMTNHHSAFASLYGTKAAELCQLIAGTADSMLNYVMPILINIAVIYTYGHASPNDPSYSAALASQGFALAGPGGFLSRWSMASAPPRINLNSLLNRNVPSIQTNYMLVKQQANVNEINTILLRESTTVPEGLNGDSSESDSDHISTMLMGQTVAIQNQNNKPNPSLQPDSIANMKDIVSERLSRQSSKVNKTGSQLRGTPNSFAIPDCPFVPPTLKGPLFTDVNHSHSENFSVESILKLSPGILPGGTWKPSECVPRHRVAVIIPYRDRKEHLMVLLGHLHPILQRQMIHYKIFVVEQYGNYTFNKARIMNIAFTTAVQQDNRWDCFIFHDVDLIPEDDRNMYTCPEQPRHMSPAIDEMNYQIPYELLVGGVLAIRAEQFFKVNGYSNLYWGWGAEDDDMAYRIQHVGLKITRPPTQVARYKMIRHAKRTAVDGRIRYRLLWTGVRRYKIDGLNSLSSLNYKIVFVKHAPIFTHIMVDVGKPPPGF